jgi:hypothetical protein
VQVKRAETSAAAASAGKKRKLSPTDAKQKGAKAKNLKKTARASKDAKLQAKANFAETLRGTPETPCAAFLESYNRVEESMVPCKKAKK